MRMPQCPFTSDLPLGVHVLVLVPFHEPTTNSWYFKTNVKQCVWGTTKSLDVMIPRTLRVACGYHRRMPP